MGELGAALRKIAPLSRTFPAFAARYMADLPREVLLAVFLGPKGVLLGHAVFAEGGVSAIAGRYRALIEPALRLGASGFLLVHNHPSGNPLPSSADIAATQSLQAVVRLLDLEFVDHLILASGGCSSLRAQGLMAGRQEAPLWDPVQVAA